MKIPTTERLARALEEAGAPERMIEDARAGGYDDFESWRTFPITQLVSDAERAGLHDIARRAKDGEFDAADWEAAEWVRSPEGQRILREFGGRKPWES